MSASREELIRLAESMPDDQMPAATELLRQLMGKAGRRTVRSAGIAAASTGPVASQ